MGSHLQVVVCGAGPTGLLTALGLARAGIEVTVVEAEAEVNRSPRATTYPPAALQALDELGALTEVELTALRCGTVDFRFLGSGGRLRLDVAILKGVTDYPYHLHMGQDALSDAVLRVLKLLPNVRVLWRTQLVGLRQDASRVELDVSAPAGPTTLTADWVVGADGARSAARRLLGVPFEGVTWPDRYVATNLRCDFTSLGFGPATMICDPDDWAVVARINRTDLWRVTYGENADLPEETAPERALERLKFYTQEQDFELVHVSPYRVHERCARTFRVGRVLLAGDAAHVVNPLGGMGLTTGMLDARELSELLAGLAKGELPDEALDYYSQERRRVYQEVSTAFARATKRMVQEPDPARRAADEAGMREMIGDPTLHRERMAQQLHVKGRRYPRLGPPAAQVRDGVLGA